MVQVLGALDFTPLSHDILLEEQAEDIAHKQKIDLQIYTC